MEFDALSLTSDAAILAALALALRALASLVTVASKALTERATARRLDAQAHLAEAEGEVAADERAATERAEMQGEVRGLRHRVAELKEQLDEQHRECAREIHEAHQAHAATMGALEQLRTDSDRAIRRMREELDERFAEMTSGTGRAARPGGTDA